VYPKAVQPWPPTEAPVARVGDSPLQLIIDAVPALVAYVDARECYRFANRAYEHWFGTPLSQVLGRHVREVLGEAAYAAIAAHIREALAGRTATFEDSLLYRDGRIRHVQATYTPDVAADGVVQGFVALVADITERKHAEDERAELRRRSEELARLARTLTAPLDVADVAQRIAESVLPLFRAQSSVVRLLEPDGSLVCVALAGKWLPNFRPGYLLPPGVGMVGRAVAERRALWTADIHTEPNVVLTDEFRRGLAAAGHHAVLAVPLQAEGEIVGALSTAHAEVRPFAPAEVELLQAFADQAALAMRNVQLFARAQAARAEAEAANRAKDQFLALLAHELRNPLAPILTAATLLHRTSDQAVRRAADVVERQARHLGRLLDDLLDVSRITRGAIELRREAVPLARAVASALEAARPAIEAMGHAVSLALPLAPLDVDADPTRLEQIIVNVLNNAAKYTPAGGRISVAVDRDGDAAVLRIRDTGIGIPGEMLGRVFDLFTQGDQSLAHTSGGLGVGLTLVRRLVELHGGRVFADSEGPGHGSQFTIVLPLSRDPDAAAPGTDAPREAGAARAVVLIEDNEDARETLRALLEDDGHHVEVAADGPSGLARAEAMRPDVVLVDLGLPGMDGYEVARRIRAWPGEEPLLVAISGYGQADDRRRSREAGFDAHLTKPVAPDHLTRVLAGLARRRGMGSP
jgi:PAS domain S-box-containing protein